MSRPIAYNIPGAAINGSITNEDKIISYVVDGRGNDYFNNYDGCTWVPSADGAAPIVFVTDTFTRGYEGDPNLAVPLFFSCAGTSSAAILYTANRLPGSPGNYTNANTALDELNRIYGYFILESNDPFQGINATNLSLSVDASKMTSYPQTANNWYDLSGTGNTISLTNGPAWSSSGWFTFDGTDDYGVSSSPSLNITGNVTMNAWIRNNGAGSAVGNYMSKAQNNGYRIRRNGGSGSPFWIYSFGNSVNGGAIYDNLWYMVTGVFSNTGLRAYINGTLVASNSTPYAPSSLTLDNLYLGAYTVGTELFGGDMMGAQVYSSALTEAQVKQNYFGSPIVTDGLVFAVDANNIVSYPKSGTSIYNLTSSISTVVGSLINGPTYGIENGGSIVFDGVDDYIDFNNLAGTLISNPSLNSNIISFSCWVLVSNPGSYYIISSGGQTGSTGVAFSYQNGSPFVSVQGNNFDCFINITPSDFPLNTWINFAFVGNGSNLTVYKNGVYLTAQNYGSNALSATQTILSLGRPNNFTGLTLGGKLAQVMFYSKALTPSEIQQNYQATQYRFETPAGPVTNGLLLYWDAGNLDSYPATGTTIYDLSGNGNNGTLVNGVGYNQVNGGVLTFDGVDDYVACSSPNLSATNNTVMGASRYSGGVRGRMINATNNNWLMGNWGTTTENYYAEGWVSTPGSGPSDTNWRIYSALGNVSGDSYSLYVNNSLSAGPSNGGSAGPNGIFINSLGEPSTGNFSFVLVYNRILTAAEMTQNYNFFKGRFGL